MKRIVVCAAAVFAVAGVPSIADAQPLVRVHILWNYKNFDSTINLAEVPEGTRLWETRSLPTLKFAPVGAEIEDGTFLLRPGRAKRFALVVKNTSSKPVFFFAAPHRVQPEEASLGFHFKCLCVGEDYRIGPGESWYRVVLLQLAKHFAGDEITLTHTIIGIDQKRAEAFPQTRSPTEF